MNSKERANAAFAGSGYERLPMWYGAEPGTNKNVMDLIFFGAIDYNEILSHGTEQQVREETRRMIDILGNDGKYIVAPSHDLMMPEVPAVNIWAMYDEAKKYSASSFFR